jgi:hypothetical protein
MRPMRGRHGTMGRGVRRVRGAVVLDVRGEEAMKPRREETIVLDIMTVVSESGRKYVHVHNIDGWWDPDQAEHIGKVLIEQADVCRRMRAVVDPKPEPTP